MERLTMPKDHNITVTDPVALTDEVVIEQVVAEAESGYEPHQLKRRGRPPLGAGPSETVGVRMPPELHYALQLRAQAESRSESDVMRAALVSYLQA
jgi:hypothetical protein